MNTKNWRFSYNSRALEYDRFNSYEDSKNEVISFLSSKFELNKMNILEVGCGTGRYTKFLADLSKTITALDLSENMLDLCKLKCKNKENITFVKCDATKLPFNENSFDLVFASWAVSSMGELKNQKKALMEMNRVLKNNSSLVLVENHWKSEFVKLLGEKPKYINSKVAQIRSIEKFEIIKTINSVLAFDNVEAAKKIIGSAIRTANFHGLIQNKPVKIEQKIVILLHKNAK